MSPEDSPWSRWGGLNWNGASPHPHLLWLSLANKQNMHQGFGAPQPRSLGALGLVIYFYFFII